MIKTIVLRLLVLLDCVVNFLLRGEITETLSARAHRMREKHQPYWWRLADFIDSLARIVARQRDHCAQAHRNGVAAGTALPWLPRWLFVKVF